jgi:molybdate transport system regulatory protein
MDRFVPHQKLWIEYNDQLVMSDYRVHLLELVCETSSIAKAANELGLSYRRAWGKIKEMESNLGYTLVTSKVGGPGGGRSELTKEGRAFLKAYQRFQKHMSEELIEIFKSEPISSLNDSAVTLEQ